MSRYLISNLLGLVGAALGGVAGFYVYRWILNQGFIGGMIPGAFLGLGCSLLARHPSLARGVVCGVAGLMLGFFTDWYTNVTQQTFWEYLRDIEERQPGHPADDRNRHAHRVLARKRRGTCWDVPGSSERRSTRPLRSKRASRVDRDHPEREERIIMAVGTKVEDQQAALRAEQVEQVEELLFSGPQRAGFAKALYRGEFRAKAIFPYPELTDSERPAVEAAVAAVREFAEKHIDAAAIDRDADIPRSVIDGLAELGVMGMAAPHEWGGRAFSQMGYCRIMEVIGGHCAATAVFVNAHHSIGLRALVLFGTPEQKARWLPFADQRRETRGVRADRRAGRLRRQQRSDHGHAVARRADLYPERQQALHHQRRNRRRLDRHGSHARPARRQVQGHRISGHSRHARVSKSSRRGCPSAASAARRRLGSPSTTCRCPPTNILGELGKGLKMALTVLDFGRTTFGASCTGLSKVILAAATRHAARSPPVRPAAGRSRADQEEDRLPRGHRRTRWRPPPTRPPP